jgi:eukaryotic translation initiation factor 2C
MVVWMHVTHPGTTSLREAPSVAAIVANSDINFAQWPASLLEIPRPNPKSGESMERIMKLNIMIKQRLVQFPEVRERFPDRIIVYRDGLSDAQFEMSKTLELPQIKSAIEKMYGDKSIPVPPILLLCAVKRHHARFFPNDKNGASRAIIDWSTGDPLPGLAVFESITYGENEDFILVSQKAIKGTARPTHYVLLHNEISGANIKTMATIVSHCYCSVLTLLFSYLVLINLSRRRTASAFSSDVQPAPSAWFQQLTMSILLLIMPGTMFGICTSLNIL